MRYLLSRVCTHAQLCLYHMLYSVELVIDWIVVPCFVSVVFSDVAVDTSPSGVISDITPCMFYSIPVLILCCSGNDARPKDIH